MGAPEEWSFQFVEEEGERHAVDELRAADALLMGRVTYQGFVAYWPTSTDPEAEHMNAAPKYVVSATLEDLQWNNSSLISGDVAQQVEALKREPGGEILLLASADLAHFLRGHGLIDEYRIWIDPLVRGRGKRYFAEGGVPTVLKLAHTKTIGPDGVVLTYLAEAPDPA